MTPEDLQLDPEFFLTRKPLILYRLARARYANLSGIGAAYAPGRWNRAGEEAVYTSTEIGVPVLERLAHTPKDLIPSNLAMMKIRVSGNWSLMKNGIFDPSTNGTFWFYRDLASARREFIAGPRSFAVGVLPFAVAVPSVIVPAWNVVLYPRAVGFWSHVALESVDAFTFDPRLFPQDASVEPQAEPEKLA
ncbi:MAG TPA: RES domain-containing protein [Terracidiphilus sp.]|nr:RES domain-containing protein [Terracidiphilus sp.]